MRGTVGFGNARAVRNLIEASIKRQSARVLRQRAAGMSPDAFQLCRDDLLGPKFLDVSASSALQDLAKLQGLKSVKDSVNTLMGLIE